MSMLSILLQDSAPAGGGLFGNGSSGLIMMVAIIAIFYFFMIRPQQKKQKDLQKAREAMKVGDNVITSGGVYGKIKEINDHAFVIEIADNVKIKIDKASVFALPNASK
ncbi:MAG: preprotein translocase subunit YajC [Dysgonamonadaceae bacterium]|nr:preprotein translocase subunit YajC [Dysgonamonadaceae bacterium]